MVRFRKSRRSACTGGRSRRAGLANPAGRRNKTTAAVAMKAVTSALARGAITPGEVAAIAAVVDIRVRRIKISEFGQRLQRVEAGCSNHPGAATA